MGNVLYPGYYKKCRGEAIFRNAKACKACTCRCTTEKRDFRYRVAMNKSDFTTDYNDETLVVKQVHIKPAKEIYNQRKSL